MKKVVNKQIEDVYVSECGTGKIYILKDSDHRYAILKSQVHHGGFFEFVSLDSTFTHGNYYSAGYGKNLKDCIEENINLGRTVYQFDTMAEAMQFCFPKD